MRPGLERVGTRGRGLASSPYRHHRVRAVGKSQPTILFLRFFKISLGSVMTSCASAKNHFEEEKKRPHPLQSVSRPDPTQRTLPHPWPPPRSHGPPPHARPPTLVPCGEGVGDFGGPVVVGAGVQPAARVRVGLVLRCTSRGRCASPVRAPFATAARHPPACDFVTPQPTAPAFVANTTSHGKRWRASACVLREPAGE
jgi:hypothetical protein